MSTRGIYGFRLLDKDYLSFNHFDSYPAGLGVDLLTQYRKLNPSRGLEVIKLQVHNIKLIPATGDLTPDSIEHLQLCFPKVQVTAMVNEVNDSRYTGLRSLQGDLIKTLDYGLMLDGADFIHDSLFCEWGYIFNLDSEELEVYCGYNKTPPEEGRYLNGPDENGFYSCRLIARLPLATATKLQLKNLDK